jgi:predicted HAD superfamily phosphohydrolase YqeG
MLRKVPMYTARHLDEVAALTRTAGSPAVVIFDADNTLVRQGVSAAEFAREVTNAIRRFRERAVVDRVVVVTNGPERGVPGMIHRGNKPWTTRRRLGLDGNEQDVWVVGDQVLTDGVLAWRLGATFVNVAIDVSDEAPRQALMRRMGRRLAGMMFRSA